MPTFIDESGDPGGGAGASPSFLFCGVTVPSVPDADSQRPALRECKSRLGLPSDYEFKFSSTGAFPERRRAFFEAALRFEWRFATVSIDKRRMPADQRNPRACQWLAVTALASIIRPIYLARYDSDPASYRKERVTVDDNRDRKFFDLVNGQFRALGRLEQPQRFLVGQVVFCDSRDDLLLQLVDMVCGAVGAHLDGDSTRYDLIRSRDVATWRFPS